jgi:hypothetical protein
MGVLRILLRILLVRLVAAVLTAALGGVLLLLKSVQLLSLPQRLLLLL